MGPEMVETEPTLENLDPELLMWDMRRNLNTDPVPARRTVIAFLYPELPAAQRKWWLIVEPDGTVDLCHIDPGFDVALFVNVDLRTMTEIWLGLKSMRRALDDGALLMTGHADLANAMHLWLGLSPFAVQKKMVS